MCGCALFYIEMMNLPHPVISDYVSPPPPDVSVMPGSGVRVGILGVFDGVKVAVGMGVRVAVLIGVGVMGVRVAVGPVVLVGLGVLVMVGDGSRMPMTPVLCGA